MKLKTQATIERKTLLRMVECCFNYWALYLPDDEPILFLNLSQHFLTLSVLMNDSENVVVSHRFLGDLGEKSDGNLYCCFRSGELLDVISDSKWRRVRLSFEMEQGKKIEGSTLTVETKDMQWTVSVALTTKELVNDY